MAGTIKIEISNKVIVNVLNIFLIKIIPPKNMLFAKGPLSMLVHLLILR